MARRHGSIRCSSPRTSGASCGNCPRRQSAVMSQIAKYSFDTHKMVNIWVPIIRVFAGMPITRLRLYCWPTPSHALPAPDPMQWHLGVHLRKELPSFINDPPLEHHQGLLQNRTRGSKVGQRARACRFMCTKYGCVFILNFPPSVSVIAYRMYSSRMLGCQVR